jgi:hypothetical protein
VEEIETAIVHLPPEDYRCLVEWLRAREQSDWDDRIDRDYAAGKLDFLFAEAETEEAQGFLRDWPTQE